MCQIFGVGLIKSPWFIMISVPNIWGESQLYPELIAEHLRGL